ncbi:MAG: cache domain-containing protein [Bacteroidetes bacterium]|nr:cache domain-containing protein [Bacteroidota bacterium]
MGLNFIKKRDITIPIATKLILGFLLIVVIMSAVFSVVGVQLIGDRIVSEAQERVRTDLNSAREIYLHNLSNIYDKVRHTAERFFLINALLSGNIKQATDELIKIKEREKLDVLTITDKTGKVLFRASNPKLFDDNQSHDELVRAVLERREPVMSTSIVSADDLRKESPLLAESAYFKFIHTPKERVRKETEETAGMMLKAAAPILDYQNNLIGIIYGGVLLNRNFEIVDKIKQTVFQNVVYEGKDIGAATIFLDDIRVSTNVKNEDGSRAIGTQVAEDVYNQVVKEGKPWIGRAFAVTDWYITAYKPIKNVNDAIIGILGIGILEQKYLDMEQRTILIFLAITLTGALVSMTLSYFISQKISGSVRKLVAASKEVAKGNLDTKVEIKSKDELRELADSFNSMASALKRRDEQLKDFARKKIMESERLAIIGQLAADVAHEINNPLQGIVAYSHLLLEKMPGENLSKESASLLVWQVKKIVTQANRCTDIIRGLLDFSRQRKPHKKPSNVNLILQECVSLVENQAMFHNIQIIRDFKENLPPVAIDHSQIQQVFMNMIINATEAMDGNGQLTLATRLESASPASQGEPVEEFIEVEFTDTGHGINEENLERIFDPFFTTKEMGHGTGLGLAISYGIIKEHEGTISVQSEVGKGTTFVVRLPVTTEEGA